jgi:hypothetical protein
MKGYRPHFLKLQHWRDPLIGSFIISGFSLLGFVFGNVNSEAPYWASMLLSFCISMVIWVSNQEVSCYLDFKLPWDANPVKRLWAMLLLNLLLGLVVLLGALWFAGTVLKLPITRDVWVTSLLFGLLITLLVNVVYVFRYFLEVWKVRYKAHEALKTLQLQEEIKGLRGQIDPHFLFNSLTALDQLIHEQPDRASAYLEKLAACYRYILRHKSTAEIAVQEELTFMQSYLELLQVRFGENLVVHWQVPDGIQGFLPFLAGQRLIENVIQHNLIKIGTPMEVYITLTPHFLEVRNLMRPKAQQGGSGEGVGLDNLKQYYALREAPAPRIATEGQWFVVQLSVFKQPVSHS